MGKIREKMGKLQVLSGTSLKIIAAVTMAVEHFSKIVLEYILRTVWGPMMSNGLLSYEEYTRIDEFIRFTLYKVGNIAYPLFFFLISEGYRYTRDRKKYMARMLIFALITELPFDIGFFNFLSTRDGTFPFYWKYQNVLFTYFFATAGLYGMDKIKERFAGAEGKKRILPIFLTALCLIAAASLAELLQCDYGATGVALIVLFYWLRERRAFQAGALLLFCLLVNNELPNLFLITAAVLILLYNGKRGKDVHPYFFYVFYPAHIFLFYLVTLVLGRLG